MFGLLRFVFDQAIYEGIGLAIVICLVGFLLSLHISEKVETRCLRRGLPPGVTGVYVGTLVRMITTVVGILAVYFLVGQVQAVVCAFGLVPLSFLEVMFSMAVQLRRVKLKQRAAESDCKSNKINE